MYVLKYLTYRSYAALVVQCWAAILTELTANILQGIRKFDKKKHFILLFDLIGNQKPVIVLIFFLLNK